MWTAFGAKYRPTAVYQVSVVLIQSRSATRSALPVRARNVHVVLFQQPVIERIMSQQKAGDPILSDQPILAGYNLVVVGQQLRGEDTQVNVGGITVPPASADVSDLQITIPLPASLQAGVQGVQVIHRRLMGTPPAPHRGVESNLAAFILRPRIDTIAVSDVQGTGNDPRSANVNLSVKPAIGPAQRVVLLLNEFTPLPSPPGVTDPTALAYAFNVPSRLDLQNPPVSPPPPSETITIPISGVNAGTYLARVQVDGAESPLGTDAIGQYNSPQLLIP
jgi:hypothetical protein